MEEEMTDEQFEEMSLRREKRYVERYISGIEEMVNKTTCRYIKTFRPEEHKYQALLIYLKDKGYECILSSTDVGGILTIDKGEIH